MDVEGVFPDDTVAGAVCDETAVVLDVAITEAAELAWSADDADEDPQPSHRRYVFPLALVVLAAAAVVVTATLFVGQLRHHTAAAGADSTVTQAAPSPAAVEPVPTVVAPSLTAALQTAASATAQPKTLADADAAYLSALSRAGFTPTNLTGAVADGHSVCTYISQGHTPQDAVVSVNVSSNNAMTVPLAYAFVRAAIDAYCPQYQMRGEY